MKLEGPSSGAAARGGGSCSIRLAPIGKVPGEACGRHRWSNRCCRVALPQLTLAFIAARYGGQGPFGPSAGDYSSRDPSCFVDPLMLVPLVLHDARDIFGFDFILCLSDPPGWEEPEALGPGFISTSIGRGNYCGSSTFRRRDVGGLSLISRGRTWLGSPSDTDLNPA